MSTTTPNLGLYIPASGDGSNNGLPWGVQMQENFEKIDTFTSDLAATTGAGLVGTAGGTLDDLLNPQSSSHSDGTNTIVGSGRIFIGNNATSGDDSAILVGRGLTGSYSTGAHGVRDESSYNPSGTGLIGYSSFDAIPAMTGTVNWNHIHSYQSRIQYSGSVQVGTERGFYHQFTHNGSGTVLQSTGIEVVDYAGTGTVTSQVGIYIGPITRGSVSNFGIYSPGATTASFHEGLWQVGTGGIVSGGPIKGTNFWTQDAQNSVAFGDQTAVSVPSQDKPGYYCTFIGRGAGGGQTSANYNTLVGAMAGYQCTTNGDNTCVGGYAGYGMIGTGNVFIGKQAGYYETGNNKLFIDNAKRTNEADGRVKALVYGVFDAAVANQMLTVNGRVVTVGQDQKQAKTFTDNGATTTFTYPANTQYQYITTSAASLATTLPATSAALDGMVITLVAGSAVATATWVAGTGGATIVGAPAALVANSPVRMIYHHATTSWYPY